MFFGAGRGASFRSHRRAARGVPGARLADDQTAGRTGRRGAVRAHEQTRRVDCRGSGAGRRDDARDRPSAARVRRRPGRGPVSGAPAADRFPGRGVRVVGPSDRDAPRRNSRIWSNRRGPIRSPGWTPATSMWPSSSPPARKTASGAPGRVLASAAVSRGLPRSPARPLARSPRKSVSPRPISRAWAWWPPRRGHRRTGARRTLRTTRRTDTNCTTAPPRPRFRRRCRSSRATGTGCCCAGPLPPVSRARVCASSTFRPCPTPRWSR